MESSSFFGWGLIHFFGRVVFIFGLVLFIFWVGYGTMLGYRKFVIRYAIAIPVCLEKSAGSPARVFKLGAFF